VKVDRDIETVLGAWLAPGPTELPDRLFRDVLDRIEQEPQRVAWTHTRSRTMLSMLKLPVAAGVVALVLWLAIFPSTRPDPAVLQAPTLSEPPTPSPSASTPSPSATRQPVPLSLRHQWLGPPKVVASLVSNASVGFWAIQGDRLTIGYGGTFLEADVHGDGPDRLRMVSRGEGPCASGAEGTYRWELTSGGTRLRLEPLNEACPPRAGFLEGDWWKGSCEITGRACMGRLEAGSYVAGAFDPRGGPDDPPLARSGAFGFTVPDGWAHDEENISSYELTTEAGYQRLVSRAEGADVIFLAAQPVALAPFEDSRCVPRMDTSVERRTVAAFSDWLTANRYLVAGDPMPITIDGHDGVVIDVDIDPTTAPVSPCFANAPGVSLFANGAAFDAGGAWFDDVVYGDHWHFGIGAAETDPIRLVLLDLDGDPLVIVLDTANPADMPAFIEQAMPIVESFTFPTP
jgi:hypothetical protein